MKKENKLLSCVMAAKILGYTPDYIRRMCASGKIKAQKVGHDWTLYESALKGIEPKKIKLKGE